ncbi:MAG: sensor domain-containing protein [Acidobacteriota bacterium]|nr:sensor domain-containing protein [Acidobacteriota bacterium]
MLGPTKNWPNFHALTAVFTGMTDTLARPTAVDHVFGAVLDPQTYRNLGYLALAYPLGLFYFVFLAVGLSVGAGLLVIVIGAAILMGVFAAATQFLRLERGLLRRLLGAEIPAAPPLQSPPKLIEKIVFYLRQPSTWRGLGWLFLRLPMGIVSLVMVVGLVPASLMLLTVPLIYQVVPMQMWDGPVTTLDQAMFFCGLGAILTLLTTHLINAWAGVYRRIGARLLMP